LGQQGAPQLGQQGQQGQPQAVGQAPDASQQQQPVETVPGTPDASPQTELQLGQPANSPTSVASQTGSGRLGLQTVDGPYWVHNLAWNARNIHGVMELGLVEPQVTEVNHESLVLDGVATTTNIQMVR